MTPEPEENLAASYFQVNDPTPSREDAVVSNRPPSALEQQLTLSPSLYLLKEIPFRVGLDRLKQWVSVRSKEWQAVVIRSWCCRLKAS